MATAAKQALINKSTGERQERINTSEGEKTKRINLAEGRARYITVIAESKAKGIEMVSKAIESSGGEEAVKMKITEEFLSALGNIFSLSNVKVVPNQLANLNGFFEGIHQVSSATSSKNQG